MQKYLTYYKTLEAAQRGKRKLERHGYKTQEPKEWPVFPSRPWVVAYEERN